MKSWSDLRPDPRECKHDPADLMVERNLGIRWVTCGECLQAFFPDWTLREGAHEAVALWLIAEARWWAENWKADSVQERWYLSEPSPFPWNDAQP